MKVKTYEVFVRAVEEGVNYGWNRAHKHNEHPDPSTIKDEIECAIVNAVMEYFEFSPETPDE